MALSRPKLNFVDGAGYLWVVTDDPALNALDIELTLSGGGGSAWYTGAGAPVTLHNDGDFYLRQSNGEVYEQVAGAWVDQAFSILGPTGATGATGAAGAAGATGAAGSQIYNGTTVPGGGLGVDGDYYLRTTTGDMYFKSSGAWAIAENLVGPTGATGAAGTSPTRQLLATWGGTMPAATGAGVVWVVPKVGGATVSFTLSYAKARVESTPSGSSAQFVLEKSAGGGVFAAAPTTVSTLTIPAASYEIADTGVALVVSSGDLLRLRFAALGGLASACAYSIELQGS